MNEIDKFWEDYEKTATEYADARNEYRNLKSKIILDLCNPDGKPEGWKRPTEKVIDAMVDNNLHLQALRSKRDKLEIMANSCRLVLEYMAHHDDC